MDWAENVSSDEANRRAGGRRHYNSIRRLRAVMRQRQIVRIVKYAGLNPYTHGVQALLARRFGVSRATISRDLRRCGVYLSWENHRLWREWEREPEPDDERSEEEEQ